MQKRTRFNKSRIAGKLGRIILSLPATSMFLRFNSETNGAAIGCRCWTRTIMSLAAYLPLSINDFILSATVRTYSVTVTSSVCLDISLWISTAPGASVRKHLCVLFEKFDILITSVSEKNLSTVPKIALVERKLCVKGISWIVRILF